MIRDLGGAWSEMWVGVVRARMGAWLDPWAGPEMGRGVVTGATGCGQRCGQGKSDIGRGVASDLRGVV